MGNDIESKIRETGLRLFQLLEEESPSLFRKEFWTGKMLDWCMQDESFKVDLFRFVDVFPYLTTSESVLRHIREYFSGSMSKFPVPVQWGMKYLPPNSIASKLLAKSISGNIASMAKNYLLGSNPHEALPRIEDLRSQGIAVTIDMLGESVVSEKEADEYLHSYFDLFDLLETAQKHWRPLGVGGDELDWGHSPKINVSLKASAMYSQMNAAAFSNSVSMAKERLRPIFRRAMQANAFVILDMEHYELKRLTQTLYRSLMEEPEFKGYPHTGIVLQAYLKESEPDLQDMLKWAQKNDVRFTIRLVKGAYWDSEVIWARQKEWPVPVFTQKHATDANFERLATIILEHHQYTALACASHNIRSIAYVHEAAKALRIPRDALEYQVLYGMGEPVRNALVKAGLPLRVYAPIGEMIQGMAYLVRRLLENTANESFLRKSFSEGVSKEELLGNPVDLLPETVELESNGSFHNEPLLDWTQAGNRDRFEAALKWVRTSMPFQVRLVIGGRNVGAVRELLSTNPNDPEEIVGSVASAGIKEAEVAIDSARRALPGWRDTPPEKRAEYLFKAAASARKLRFELAALQVIEVGKSWGEADADVCEAIDFLEYYGREMIRLGSPIRMGRYPGEISHLFYQPRGVCAVIAPWNFPMAISTGMASAAIVTGNTVVYKPASQSPVVGYMVHRIFEEAKLPAGVLNYLPGSGSEIGDCLVSHPDVAMIAFTGSKNVGLHLLELASKTPPGATTVKNVIAEMGGKNAIIVDDDADLDEAVRHIIHAAFSYQGQKCSACSRLIVLEGIYDRLLERLKAAAESLALGPPEDPKNFMGAVIEASAAKKIADYIALGKQEGNLLIERNQPGAKGHFVPLSIFVDIKPEHRLAQEEIFGPVLSIMKAASFDEAIEMANATQYALTGGLFSRSPEHIAKAKREFRTGNLYINRGCTGAIVGRHPFGGFKMSGIGSKTGGPDYLLQFMVPVNVVENTLRRGFAPADE